MITIVLHEIEENIKSLRFLLMVLFSILLFTVNGLLFVPRINDRINSYSGCINNTKNRSTVVTTIHKKPSLLLFIADGEDKYGEDQYLLYPSGNVEPDNRSSVNYNYKMPDSADLDWVFIIKIIFSLYALLLSFDAVSGEKELGTLRLILSNPLNRISFLIGKYCSVIIIIFIPLIIGMTISFFILFNSLPEILSLNTFLSMSLVLLFSFIYLSIFVLLSLIFSSAIHQSSLALLVVLSIWLMFLIIPDVSIILSKKLTHVPSEYSLTRQQNDENLPQNYIVNISRRIEDGEFASEREIEKEGQRLILELEDRLKKNSENYIYSMNLRENSARIISRFSPMALFQYIAENIAVTGYKSLNKFLDDIAVFSPVYDSYVLQKVGRVNQSQIYTYGLTYFWSVEYKGKKIRLSVPRPERYQGYMSDFPIFHESKPSFTRTLRDAMLDLSGLLLWNLVLAMGAFIAFNRADVR